MKQKDVKGKELERIDNELFRPFDAEDESWIIGGSYTITGTAYYTLTGNSPDYQGDADFDYAEFQP